MGKIILMHVLDFPSGSFNTTGEMSAMDPEIIFHGEFIKGVHNRLEEIKSSLSKDVEIKIKYGNPYISISIEIAEEEVDYIIMGSDGASGLKEVFIGSVAEKVIRNAVMSCHRGKRSIQFERNEALGICLRIFLKNRIS